MKNITFFILLREIPQSLTRWIKRRIFRFGGYCSDEARGEDTPSVLRRARDGELGRTISSGSFILVLLLVLFLFPIELKAMMHVSDQSVNEESYLSDEEYERLGEEWMEAMHGENHEEMDNYMSQMMARLQAPGAQATGGQGDDFLKQMHIAMGKMSRNPGNFGMMSMMMGIGGLLPSGLSKQEGFQPRGLFSPEGGGMNNMMYGMGNSYMMGGSGLSLIWSILGLVTWVAFIVFLLAGARWFWRKGDNRK